MRELEVKLKEMALLCDDDIITILNMRVDNIDLLKRKRVEVFRSITIPEAEFLKEHYPDMFNNNFIEDAVQSGDI